MGKSPKKNGDFTISELGTFQYTEGLILFFVRQPQGNRSPMNRMRKVKVETEIGCRRSVIATTDSLVLLT